MIERADVDRHSVTVANEPGVVSIVGPIETVRKIYDANVQAEAGAATARTSPTQPAEDRAGYESLVDFTTDRPVRFDEVLAAMGDPEPTPIIDRMNWNEFLGNGYQATLSLDGQTFAARATEKDGVVTELEISPHNNASFWASRSTSRRRDSPRSSTTSASPGPTMGAQELSSTSIGSPFTTTAAGSKPSCGTTRKPSPM